MKKSLTDIQKEVNEWSSYNFGDDRPAHNVLLGAMEELGELAHAHLKSVTNIRINENHEEHAKDSVCDIIIFLIDYCCIKGWNLEEVLISTWAQVNKRDWKKFPVNGIDK